MDASIFVHLFHMIVVGGLFMYVGIMRNDIAGWLYNVLLILGIVIILYHLYKGYKKIINGNSAWVNYIHIFIVGPLLIYIGYNKNQTKRLFYELLLILGFASIGYHGYYLIKTDKK